MSDKRLGRADLLRSLLGVLVDEWGFEAVRDYLEEFRASGGAPSAGAKAVESERNNEARRNGTPKKTTASTMAAKVNLPPAQKQLVQLLAAKYDKKQFLPTSGDIRYFFEVHGEAVPPVKQRSEAFRKVLRLLSSMPESALRKMIDSGAHSGPSSLAPLSDAMRGVGERRLVDRAPTEMPSFGGEADDRPQDRDGRPSDD
ncbi:MAG: hypothetical protein A4E62_00400 [Syntrophorhabdus sp. PtaU1.Bin002]|nr:MAG: hypothetical protein A4E62_00400 [Syntrophorhabdus sp. PtaU1.Bin002]